MFAATHADAQSNRFSRITLDGKQIWRSRYFGPSPSPENSSSLAPIAGIKDYIDPRPGEVREPQAFLVEQEPGAIVQPHFHYVDQFQVVAAGDGFLGRHPVAPLSVHFAGASTGYGPIQPGDKGLSYFTFRASADDTGAQYMPASRSRMRPGPRRNEMVTLRLSSPHDLAYLADSAVESALDHPDGLAVFLLHIAPRDTLLAPDASLGQGASMLVASGAILSGERRYPAWSCFFASNDEGRVTLQADENGAEVLVLRYPRKQAPAG